MCGIAGYLGNTSLVSEDASGVLDCMAGAIVSRGPDGAGNWSDSQSGIGLTHRRLAIVDLSPAGHQPMYSPSDRYVIAFNGEIYNHLELRDELVKSDTTIQWKGHSDTETLVAGFDQWGIVPTIERCAGMFAIAVWDKQLQTLSLIRDRLGEKPLYYGWVGQGAERVFLFGSELKALKAHPDFRAEINRDALALMLRHNYIPAPYSIYQGIQKLLPGYALTVSLANPTPVLQQYWSLEKVATAARKSDSVESPEQAVEALDELLKSVVRKQMMADVPLGAFLSGGVDSSAIVALMQTQSDRPIKTFTIGFNEEGYNEAEHAKAVAAHLGTEHTELYVSPEQAMSVIPMLPKLYDEPFSDSSQIPTFLVSQLARQHVTVSLSGDAGDELFCGYNRYLAASGVWNKLEKIPMPVRKLLARVIQSVSPATWNTCLGALPLKRFGKNLGDKLHKASKVLASDSIGSLYKGLVSHWDDPSSVVIGSKEPPTLLTGNAPALTGLNPIERMMALDMLTYLPDDILAKVDRAAMGVSLETRVPFLDHRVVEYAWRMPLSLKLREGQSKWLLKQVLYRYVPKAYIERPKMGFGIPLDVWLRGPLRDWAENLINEERLRKEGYFHPEPIRKKWAEHLSGERNWAYHLWDILSFQAWLEENA